MIFRKCYLYCHNALKIVLYVFVAIKQKIIYIYMCVFVCILISVCVRGKFEQINRIEKKIRYRKDLFEDRTLK